MGSTPEARDNSVAEMSPKIRMRSDLHQLADGYPGIKKASNTQRDVENPRFHVPLDNDLRMVGLATSNC